MNVYDESDKSWEEYSQSMFDPGMCQDIEGTFRYGFESGWFSLQENILNQLANSNIPFAYRKQIENLLQKGIEL